MSRKAEHPCNKPLEKSFEHRAAIEAVNAAVDAALGEVTRQGGGLGNIAIEARSIGVNAGLYKLPRCARAFDHEGACDDHAYRGVDFNCEKCGKLDGFFIENGFRRCKKCGYPSK